MHLMRYIFMILVVSGNWRPESWTSTFKKSLYNVYTMVLMASIYSVTALQLLHTILSVGDRDEFTGTFFLFVTNILSCYKMYDLLMSRQNVMLLCKILEMEPFFPRDEMEMEIRRKFEKKSKHNTMCFGFLVEFTAVWMLFITLPWNVKKRQLPYKMWMPRNYSTMYYGFAYVQEVLGLLTGSLTQIAYDTLFTGFLIHVCCQIDIMGYRLKSLKPGEDEAAKHLVVYHCNVYRFVRMINEEFQTAIFSQFAGSTLIVCMNLYLIATAAEGFSEDQVKLLFYVSCILTQIFYYCWYGNEVKVKSHEIPDMIFHADWPSLSKDAKRVLLMIMRRSIEPIEIRSLHVVTLTLDSYVSLLKTSYSAYNVLQQGKKT